jgi:predicted GIY-YIG superfamily endonuclease
MWDLGQLIVLLSRVTNMKMITFVGSKQDNLNAVEEIMTKEGKFTEAITERLVALDVLTSPPQRIITEQANPFLPIRREIPNVAQGYVYLLVCIHEPYVCYVGETGRSLMLRLREHNSGVGSVFTKGKAWGLYAYVYNFPSPYQITNREMREWFETTIHRAMRKNSWPWQVKDAMKRATTDYNVEHKAACIVHEVARLDEHIVRSMARQRGSNPQVRADPPQGRVL